MKSYNQHRHKDNPIEKKLHDLVLKWHKENKLDFSQVIFGSGDNGVPNKYLTAYEQEIVCTVIQWLGSPVGQGFLAEAGFTLKSNKP